MAIAYDVSNGFDNGTLRLADVDHNRFCFISATPHTGAYALWFNPSSIGGYAQFKWDTAPSNPSVSFWLKLGGCYSDTLFYVLFVMDGTDITFNWNPTTHTFDLSINSILVESGTIEVPVNDYFNVQIRAEIDSGTGYVGLKINGIPSISFSGDTKTDSTNAVVTHLAFGQLYSLGHAHSSYMDDVVLGHGDDYLGDCRVDWLAPTADTVADDWLKSVGVDAYAVVDEIPNSDSDYLYTETDADETELAIALWDGTDKTPVMVSAVARILQTAATGDQVNLGVDSNGTDGTEAVTPETEFRYYSHHMELNPDGDVAWNEAAIQALLFRIESVF